MSVVNSIEGGKKVSDEEIWWGVPTLEELENNRMKNLLFLYRLFTMSFTYSPMEKTVLDCTCVSFLMIGLYFMYKIFTYVI